jgi:PKD repeat protein
MIRYFLLLFVIFFKTPCSSQTHEHNDCGQHILLKRLLENPKRLQLHIEEQEQFVIEEKSLRSSSNTKGTIYKVPIVFHIIHNGGIENISNAQILDALEILNRDFRKLNADTATVAPQFQGVPADIEIEFVLATKAPDGSCFSGITRTQSPLSYVSDFSEGSDQVNAIISENDVYQGNWPGNNYLNIIVCGNPSDGVAGYTHYPSNFFGTSMENGIWMKYNYMGSIGTSNPTKSRVLAHEAGHWFNLPHTWGSTNEPGLPSNCNSDDGVADTPNTIGSYWCNYNDTACGPIANVENYMNYASSCRKMFTPGQATRMRTAITSSIGGRNNLWQSSNLVATGTDGPPPFCKADFIADRLTICAGDSIYFTDNSFHNVLSWNWSFNGGAPFNSTNQNPIITYNNPGKYEVSLVASDGLSSLTESKIDYITVLPSSGLPIPYNEGFENTILPNNDWTVNNDNWEVTTNAFSNGAFSAQLNNQQITNGGIQELISNTIDLSGETEAVITFKYAYANKNTNNNDHLHVLASKDCGETWSVRKIISNQYLPTAPNQSWAFIPSSNQWQEVYVTSIVSSYCVSDFRFKFAFYSDGGNNFYIDDINIFSASVLSIKETNPSINLFPNPINNLLNIESDAPFYSLKVYDIYGRTVTDKKNLNSTSLSLNSENWAKGIYLINIQFLNQNKFVKIEKL